MTRSASNLDKDVETALRRVHDPCSIAAGCPVSIVDMGLVRDWELDEQGTLFVTMCVTSKSCMMAPHFTRAAEDELRRLNGVTDVRIDIDPGVFWTTDMMTEAGQRAINENRQRYLTATKARPQQWRESGHGARESS